jgi:SAM-dependent methyltransferase
MTATAASAGVDLGAIKQRQQAMWASGNFAMIASRILIVSELLVEAADLKAGCEVLDVATGNGNAAIAAARRGCVATGVDYVPALIEHGRQRAALEGLEVELLVGDAESLPFPDASFDAVTSVFGTMFAPDHPKAAAELVRVCRPGGTIALASWTPTGFLGELFRTTAAHVPPPAGVASPLLWGTEPHLADLLGDRVQSLDCREQTYTFRYGSAAEFVDFFRTWYGPTLKAFEALDEEGRSRLESDLVDLISDANRLDDGGPVAVDAAYLEAVAVRS